MTSYMHCSIADLILVSARLPHQSVSTSVCLKMRLQMSTMLLVWNNMLILFVMNYEQSLREKLGHVLLRIPRNGCELTFCGRLATIS